MTQSTKIRTGAGILALALAAGLSPAHAQDSMPARAINALGLAIAAQGDAALEQIRRELKDTLLEGVRPYLPRPETSPQAPPAAAATPPVPADQRPR
jgi:hypothetical protein